MEEHTLYPLHYNTNSMTFSREIIEITALVIHGAKNYIINKIMPSMTEEEILANQLQCKLTHVP